MEALKSYFDKELIFIEDAKDQNEIFNRIGKILYEKGIVNDKFIDALIEREKNYPTGLDLKPVSVDLPNAAIPHTETEYCHRKHVVFVKLEKPVLFKNMIAPDQELEVTYLFFIINNEKDSQTNILSELMGFLTAAENVNKLEKLQNKDEIYRFLTNNIN
ncbi:PTS sugar transporter subunit IIA [Virgibacillus sp. YIM 98842]|uniref:PTS sugar transporter subunit IIA n=1 Tax=Virgibacillus sp. YIM 98842 TaxID=2663533 RepID=UPI0013DD34EE|nr:PTS sugar transporter subunit IIA [Virgibacillus sp. YIM 98842]